eukprot:comp22091_c0_seq1/m.32214 comp22091_c0_seq1/g.32214  ORF comp22091_c0_seq1/g.32214 comp22091_c0_seq1/m.32214 type:complete len:389 (-) comp22091_c0_seq1:398-1564(-)
MLSQLLVCAGAATVALGADSAAPTATAPVVGAEKCTQGPSYWCSSEAAVKECLEGDNSQCWKYCSNKMYSLEKSEVCKNFTLPGADPCTWGPSFWCDSQANVDKCLKGDATDCKEKYCTQESLKNSKVCKGNSSVPMVGGDPCTWGPSYWCASNENAKKCNFDTAECAKYCAAAATEYKDLVDSEICKNTKPMVGSNKCTQGPSYWCSSQANAKSCNFTWATECGKYCTAAKNNEGYANIASGDVCTSKCLNDPSYFCKTWAQAKECGVSPSMCRPFCFDKTNNAADFALCKKQPKVSAECMKGPSYWCSNASSAKACKIPVAKCQSFCADTKKHPALAEAKLCKRFAEAPVVAGTEAATATAPWVTEMVDVPETAPYLLPTATAAAN